MRVNGIHNIAPFCAPLTIEKNKEDIARAVKPSAGSGDDYSALNHLSFLGKIIRFDNYIGRKNDKLTNPANRASNLFAMQYFLNLPMDEDASQDIASVLNSAYIIQNSAAFVYERFDNIYNDTYNVICDVYKNLRKDNTSRNCFKIDNKLIELDKKGNLLRETTFRNNFPEIIRNYKNNSVIFIESKKDCDKLEDFTVYFKCKNIDDAECIKAREAFTFKEGKPYRYCAAVEKDVSSDRLVADRAYTYNGDMLSGYDLYLTVAGGVEYSGEYYEFRPKINADYLPVFNESAPVRFVTNKIVSGGHLIHSNQEIVLSEYLKKV